MLLHAPSSITISSLQFTNNQTRNFLKIHRTETTKNHTILNQFTSFCNPTRPITRSTCKFNLAVITSSLLACLVILASTAGEVALSAELLQAEPPPEAAETLSNIPQTLSGKCVEANDCKKARIQRPKSRKAESCTIKCVTTCIRGGEGSPGEGPLNIRRPLVVFKPGFRSRHYCLVECSDICNLIGDGDDGLEVKIYPSFLCSK